MKRSIDRELLSWKNSGIRKPLLIGSARHVGKTKTAQNFSTFESAKRIFGYPLYAVRNNIIRDEISWLNFYRLSPFA